MICMPDAPLWLCMPLVHAEQHAKQFGLNLGGIVGICNSM